MKTMAPVRHAGLRSRRVQLAAEPAAAARARRQVRAAVESWAVPVDADVAVLLTSELVTNAILHAGGRAVTLVIGRARGHLRVEVHDASRRLPTVADACGGAETGRGLVLVATLAHEWGFYSTPAGKAVYFTLAFGSAGDPEFRHHD